MFSKISGTSLGLFDPLGEQTLGDETKIGESSVSCELDWGPWMLKILEKYGLFCVKRHQTNQQQKTYRIPGGMHHESL